MTSSRKIIRLLQREWPQAEVGYTNSGHIQLRFPNGKIVTAAGTPTNEYRFIRNTRADIRRALRGGQDGSQ